MELPSPGVAAGKTKTGINPLRRMQNVSCEPWTLYPAENPSSKLGYFQPATSSPYRVLHPAQGDKQKKHSSATRMSHSSHPLNPWSLFSEQGFILEHGLNGFDGLNYASLFIRAVSSSHPYNPFNPWSFYPVVLFSPCILLPCKRDANRNNVQARTEDKFTWIMPSAAVIQHS